jgi:hypothetical protein
MPNQKDDDYEVGYRKPPRRNQFTPGRSGNPKGRPRGSMNFETLLEQALTEKVIITENGRRTRKSKLHVVIKQVVNKAAQSDHRATRLILEWTERLQIKDSGGGPLTVVQLLEAIGGISDEDEI